MESRVLLQCDICETSSTVCCIQSHQFYCDDCFKQHTREAATETHSLITTNPMTHQLPGCNYCNDQKEIVKICVECKDIFCTKCSDRHPRFSQSKDHSMISLNEFHGSLCMELSVSRAESRPQTAKSEKSTSNIGAQVFIAKLPDKRKHSGRLLSENTCAAPGETKITRIRGMAVLQDGRILIIDSGNCCLKIFNGEGCDYVAKKELQDEPRGIAYVSQDDFIVSYAYKKEIVNYKIDKANNILAQKSYRMPDKPFSISYSKKTLAVEMGEGDDGKIVITDSNGVITHRVRGPYGFALFNNGNSIRIAHEHDKKWVYIAYVGGLVYCLAYDGETIWKVSVSSPQGLALAGDNSTLFVASKDTNKIYHIATKNGEIYNLLDEQDKILVPRFLAFNSTKQRLVVEVGSYFNVYEVTEGQKKKR